MTKEKAFEFLEKAISHISSNFCYEERETQLDDELEGKLPFEYSIDAGISKAVILIKGAPYVLKLPFFKIYTEESYQDVWNDWDEEREEVFAEYLRKRIQETGNLNYELTREERLTIEADFRAENPEPDEDDFDPYLELEGADNIDLGADVMPTIPSWDYCRLESVIYQLAVEEGLGAYFAEEAYLGTIDNTPVYYQTRCTPMSSMSIDYNSKEYKEKAKKSEKICEKLKTYCFNEVWISDFIDLYGEKEFKRLDDFLDRYGIEDLRTCNIGYLDGAPILFDYSSYRGW